jgi:hypothetical protein
MKKASHSRKGYHLARTSIVLLIVALIAGMAGCDRGGYYPPPLDKDLEIRDWYDLDDVRDNVYGNHILLNDLDSSSPGYTELAGPMAHSGKGWKPIDFYYQGVRIGLRGTFDGQGHEIRDMFINRPTENCVGLFGSTEGGTLRDVGVVNATVVGAEYVGALVGENYNGVVSNSYSSSNVTGDEYVGGLVGYNVYPASTMPIRAIITSSWSTGSVTGNRWVGGLAGANRGTVVSSYSTSGITGDELVGGLVGANYDGGSVVNTYFEGSVDGTSKVGGLVGVNDYEDDSTVSNSHYNYEEVLINGKSVITVGALFQEDFEQWLTDDKVPNVNERLVQEDGYYGVNNVTDFRQLLAFGQNATLAFRLNGDLDLSDEPGLYIPFLAGEFDGDGHKISNLSLNLDFVCDVGLFGCLGTGGNVTDLTAQDVNITGDEYVGGLVGFSMGTVLNSSSTGCVTGHGFVGGLVGCNWYSSTVSGSQFAGTVTGENILGGVAGQNMGSVNGSYSTGNVNGISDQVGGLVGHNAGIVSNSHAIASVVSDNNVGGLVGENGGEATVSNCYSSGDVTAYTSCVGGLVGASYNIVSNSYSTASVTGTSEVGGLVGVNGGGEGVVTNSYSTGSVTGGSLTGGLVGDNAGTSIVSHSFWNIQTSGQATSDGGIGKTSAQMKNISTFSGAGWGIAAVADSGTRNIAHIWNIVDGVTYPFLSWQS